ncbi:hypothetical protein RDWZM_003673 [Blomia tropicalis]|uniref:Uncharacterized protein n=1 Tax=Blomia tropicalis TaxID=40697 RepID=A0A9Q0RR38_BLOTA|nr:hypothetical protein RDWZM_003673 [Blomia tropicalis]
MNTNQEANGGDSNQLLQCYNISCGQKYRESENGENTCIYHEGKPYFHDGYKEWTCCKMRSRDFTIFMGFKGCTRGRHSNVKPVEEKSENNGSLESEEQTKNEDNSNQVEDECSTFVPPDENSMANINIVESPNVASAPPIKNIVICKNCKAEESTLNLSEECLYHRGIQVFHDSLKFWSCCPNKKFTEFEDFQKLPPCSKADSHELMIKVDYKENWFQTGGNLTIALYGLRGARIVDDKSFAIIRGGRELTVRLVNSKGIIIFENKWRLYDFVLAEGSKVTINPSNTQIVLQKANNRSHWPDLIEKPPKSR